jgi:chromosome segregation ATPase
MVPRKSLRKPATLESLATLISRTAASADKKFAALADDIADIKSSMPTKDDFARLDKGMASLSEQTTGIERELKSIRRDLNDLTEKFENISGFRKEIDHALERIAAIEKHLGLSRKTAV